jgi:hypothetical protein
MGLRTVVLARWIAFPSESARPPEGDMKRLSMLHIFKPLFYSGDWNHSVLLALLPYLKDTGHIILLGIHLKRIPLNLFTMKTVKL